jgi:peptide/nickel transport system permease protein
MNETGSIPTKDILLNKPPDYPLRKLSWLERKIGPEWYKLIYGVFTNPLSVIGLIITSIFILTAAFAPMIAPTSPGGYDYYLIPRDGYSSTPKPPGTIWKINPPEAPGWYQAITKSDKWVHLLGTNSGQFDIFYGVIWGTRIALFVGVVITAIAVLIGLIMGAIAGFYGGVVDDLLMRFTEIFMAFPFLLAALTLSAILVPLFGRGIWPATIALICFGWMTYMRMIRGEVLSAKERDYVMSARVIGAKDSRTLFNHIMPNAIYPILILASMSVGDYVLSFATLSFLGVGTEIGYADWGQIISFSRDWILSLDQYWYIIIYPGIALLLFGLGWNLIGDSLRDILDPRMRRTN